MAEIELLDKSFKLIRDGLFFGEVIHKEHVESFLQENERKINELQAEIERLKSELQQSATTCNKLKCLALHAMSEWLWALSLFKKVDGRFLKPHVDIKLCESLAQKYHKAYRKAKKALMEGK